MSAIRIIGAVFAVLASFSLPTIAQDTPAVKITGASDSLILTRDELEEMGLVSIKTTTPWNEGVIDFEGVPIALLLEKAQVEGDTVTVTALNDYSVDIPMSDLTEFGVILAVKRDGEYMPVDDQGPFFVIYPFDSNPSLQGQPYYGRAVWQVKEITVQ